MTDEKRFLKPEAEIIEFLNNDIVTTSGEDDLGGENIGGIY